MYGNTPYFTKVTVSNPCIAIPRGQRSEGAGELAVSTIGMRWPRLCLADTFGFCFRWRPFKGSFGAQSAFWKFRSGQWFSAGEYQL
jgi:hypothetical protein